MCGRYTVSNPGEILPELLGHDAAPEMAARYNVAPTQDAPVVVAQPNGERSARLMRWGLVPYWANGIEIGGRMINARAETAATKPAFRDSFARRRCLVAADGFYEWQRIGGGKQPYLIRLAGGAPMAFAGLWDRWRGPRGRVLESFAIVTTGANELVEAIHDRMPVVLTRNGRATWLDVQSPTDDLIGLLRPTAEPMETVPVSDRVNNPANDSLDCLQPVIVPPAPTQGSLF